MADSPKAWVEELVDAVENRVRLEVARKAMAKFSFDFCGDNDLRGALSRNLEDAVNKEEEAFDFLVASIALIKRKADMTLKQAADEALKLNEVTNHEHRRISFGNWR